MIFLIVFQKRSACKIDTGLCNPRSISARILHFHPEFGFDVLPDN